MISRTLIRRAFTLHLTTSIVRALCSVSSNMPTPIQSFVLNRQIWNTNLYDHMRDFWFAGLPDDQLTPNQAVKNRWFGVDLTPDQKKNVDEQCRQHYAEALESIAPDKLSLPAFESYERDIEEADTLAAPFLIHVKEAQTKDTKQGAETLLSMILLLDQMTRNIYRDPAGLKLVFTHYDRLAFSLLHSSWRLDPSPVEHADFRRHPLYNSWLIMPLMHAEHMPSHKLWREATMRWKADAQAVHGQEAGAQADNNVRYDEMHTEPLEKFGRYPHRNGALGKTNTKAEEEYLESASTFGVQQQKDSGKKSFEKSEL